MSLLRKTSKKPSRQVTVVKAVNGGLVGHSKRQSQLPSPHQRRQQQIQQLYQLQQRQEPPIHRHRRKSSITKIPIDLDDFWAGIDECEFVKQDPTTTPILKTDTTGLLLGNARGRRQRQYSSETARTRQSSTQTTRSGRDEQDGFWRAPVDEPAERQSILVIEDVPVASRAQYQIRKKTSTSDSNGKHKTKKGFLQRLFSPRG